MLNQVDITATLKRIPWFLDLSSESIQSLADIADICSFQANDVIFSEGEQHPFLYILLEGKVSLESYVPGYGFRPICTCESLDVIGWSSLTPVVRQKTSTARVVEQTSLLIFHADSLVELCESEPELGFVIMRRLANIVASRLLCHRLHLLGLITCQGEKS
jgi:CRP-like cAMP-binding protein